VIGLGILRCRETLAVFFPLALPGRPLALSGGLPFPPSIVIANCDRVFVGQAEALAWGAFVAPVGDSASGW